MIKIPITNYYLKDVMPNNDKIKKDFLQLLKNSSSDSLKDNNDFYENKISKLDFDLSYDMNRPWVKKMIPEMIVQLEKMINTIGYYNLKISALWYQQYFKSDIHDWHIHGDNFTGVYYLEFPKGSPETKLYNNKIISPKIEEGDICIFPSTTPHIAPRVINDVRKTIISFNFNVIELNHNMLNEVRNA